jgi:transcriptional regulator with XRE-family HTH domain
MDTIGKKIREARKRRGLRGEDLGAAIGLTKSSISKIENDEAKGGVDATILVRIADALDAPEILLYHCQACPIRQHVVLRYFPELNNIRRDPAVIAARLRKEMVEAAEALDRLGERFSAPDFKNRPDYQEIFEREMEQVIDVKRGIEILEFELVLEGVHTPKDLKSVYERQQAKCEARGHHKPKGSK